LELNDLAFDREGCVNIRKICCYVDHLVLFR
jgi:hypothetical protein